MSQQGWVEHLTLLAFSLNPIEWGIPLAAGWLVRFLESEGILLFLVYIEILFNMIPRIWQFLPIFLFGLFTSCESLQFPQPNDDNSSVTGHTSHKKDSSLAQMGLRRTGNVLSGKASWYSVRTNGGTATASGERFRNDGRTAAHKSLPMGTMVEVTNLLNDRKVVLRINDRGPYIRGGLSMSQWVWPVRANLILLSAE